jgi:uncharacterized membrane protein
MIRGGPDRQEGSARGPVDETVIVPSEMRMSHGVSGRPSRLGPVSRLALLLGLLAVIAGPVAPLALAAADVSVTTPFPAVVAEPGSTASFKLTLKVGSAHRVDLKANGVPDGWTARFRGGGLVIDGAYVSPGSAPDVSLDVEIPDGATAGSTTITVVASDSGGSDSLPLQLRVADAAAGDVTLTSDFPELKGAAGGDFTFNLTLHNDTAAETTFSMDATGPAGWTVAAKPAGQAQATSTTVKPGSTGSITVTASPPADVAADTYPISVTTTGGGKNAKLDLAVTITGTYTLALSTPDQVLSTSANAGSEKDLTLTLSNTGSAPITNLALTANAPTGWKVEFAPATVESLPPTGTGGPVTVTAKITPSGDAIAGDYEMTITGKGAEATDDVSIRVRVETPQLWWIVGIVLIVLVFAGLYWVFRTYGRR